MKIIDTSIKLRVSVVVMTVLVSLGGIYAYLSLPKESNPSIEIPNIVITTIYPGASPKDVESLPEVVVKNIGRASNWSPIEAAWKSGL